MIKAKQLKEHLEKFSDSYNTKYVICDFVGTYYKPKEAVELAISILNMFKDKLEIAEELTKLP